MQREIRRPKMFSEVIAKESVLHRNKGIDEETLILMDEKTEELLAAFKISRDKYDVVMSFIEQQLISDLKDGNKLTTAFKE